MDQIIAKNIFPPAAATWWPRTNAQIIDRTVNVLYEA